MHFFLRVTHSFNTLKVPLLLCSVIKRYSGGVQYYILNYKQICTDQVTKTGLCHGSNSQLPAFNQRGMGSTPCNSSGIYVDRVAMGQVYLQVLQSLPTSNIPPTFRTHSSINTIVQPKQLRPSLNYTLHKRVKKSNQKTVLNKSW